MYTCPYAHVDQYSWTPVLVNAQSNTGVLKTCDECELVVPYCLQSLPE